MSGFWTGTVYDEDYSNSSLSQIFLESIENENLALMFSRHLIAVKSDRKNKKHQAKILARHANTMCSKFGG